MNADYHIHTKLCKHARGEMEEYVEQALHIGLKEIAFTDHIPLPDNFDIAHRMAYHELEGYANKIQQLQKSYPDIIIKTGIEADFYDGFEDYLYQTLNRFQFDLVIMAVHFVKGWGKSNWAFSYYFPDKSLKQIYSEYLQAVKRGINTGLFNIVGHLDLIKSEDHSVLELNEDEVKDILQAAKEQNMAVELNTSGLCKSINETYPNLNILPMIAEKDLPITFGSDAHQPDRVGFYFNELREDIAVYPSLKYARFENRRINTILQNKISY